MTTTGARLVGLKVGVWLQAWVLSPLQNFFLLGEWLQAWVLSPPADSISIWKCGCKL